jgi:hypothetical protein
MRCEYTAVGAIFIAGMNKEIKQSGFHWLEMLACIHGKGRPLISLNPAPPT